ncbi:MAG: DUF167 domain-containing protein [Candidatus Gastranaerophilales bacterium]|nr:DUF167 domain-containing protein [Candidatus Gastranaerophilales bacterium]
MQNTNTLKISEKNNGIVFQIKAVPNSSCSKITEINEEFIKIKLYAPPVEGKANKEIILILSKMFKVPKSSVKILHGEQGKLKTIFIDISKKEFLKILYDYPSCI